MSKDIGKPEISDLREKDKKKPARIEYLRVENYRH